MTAAAVAPTKTVNGGVTDKEELRKLRHRFAQQRYKRKLKLAQKELEQRAERAVHELSKAHESLQRKDNLIQEMRTIIAVQNEEIQQLKALQVQLQLHPGINLPLPTPTPTKCAPNGNQQPHDKAGFAQLPLNNSLKRKSFNMSQGMNMIPQQYCQNLPYTVPENANQQFMDRNVKVKAEAYKNKRLHAMNSVNPTKPSELHKFNSLDMYDLNEPIKQN